MFEKASNNLIYSIYLTTFYYPFEICLWCEYCSVHSPILRESNPISYPLRNNMFKLIRVSYKELGKLKCTYQDTPLTNCQFCTNCQFWSWWLITFLCTCMDADISAWKTLLVTLIDGFRTYEHQQLYTNNLNNNLTFINF